MTAFLRGNRVVLRAQNGSAWTDDREVSRFMSRGAWPGGVRPDGNEVELDIYERDACPEHRGPLGVTGLHNIAWVPRSAEFRILIGDKSAWGNGYGTEATMLMCAYAFEILNLHKVWLGVVAENQAAVTIYERVGFVGEGVLRDEVYRNREYYDAIRMSMTRGEYDRLWKKWPIVDALRSQFPQVTS